MQIDVAYILVEEIKRIQQSLECASNDDLRNYMQQIHCEIHSSVNIEKALCDNLCKVYAAVKELARRLSTDDIVVTANAKDVEFAKKVDFVEIDGKYAIYRKKWSVYGQEYRWNMIHYDEQLLGGIMMHHNNAIEMATGEGKTLVATLPVTLNALTHKGVHITTTNSFLSQRDFEMTRPLYAFWGLSSGCIELWTKNHDAARKAEYNADITFGTNSSFTFDYLFDHLAEDKDEVLQKGHYFAVIDELDSILIDKAITPHIIGSSDVSLETHFLLWKDAIVELLSNQSLYRVDLVNKSISLTPRGENWISLRPEKEKEEALYNKEDKIKFWDNIRSQLLHAYAIYQKDVDYILYDGKVVIIDEQTGRMLESNRWENGLHTAVELKENLLVSTDLDTIAVISVKNFFRLYDKISGMSGTILSVSDELNQDYGLNTVKIPTHKPLIREDKPLRIFKTEEQKITAIVQCVTEEHKSGRPILIGCRDILKANKLIDALEKAGLIITKLDATDYYIESHIISQAGEANSILISTSMAGRGTDIKLSEDARRRGGLLVIAADMFTSLRIDLQLVGRSGRQGDQGTSMRFVSADDVLVEYLTTADRDMLTREIQTTHEDEISSDVVRTLFANAQLECEERNRKKREKSSRKDDSIAPFRDEMYQLRQQVLQGGDISSYIKETYLKTEQEILYFEQRMNEHYETVLDYSKKIKKYFPKQKSCDYPFIANEDMFAVLLSIDEISIEKFKQEFIRQSILSVLDKYWKKFVQYISGQEEFENIIVITDNYLAIKQEMEDAIFKRLMNAQIPLNHISDKSIDKTQIYSEKKKVTFNQQNDTCPCGSGKPFTECHGQRKKIKRR